MEKSNLLKLINKHDKDIYKELSDKKYDKYTFGVKQIKVSASGVINIKWEC